MLRSLFTAGTLSLGLALTAQTFTVTPLSTSTPLAGAWSADLTGRTLRLCGQAVHMKTPLRLRCDGLFVHVEYASERISFPINGHNVEPFGEKKIIQLWYDYQTSVIIQFRDGAVYDVQLIRGNEDHIFTSAYHIK
jgi:hypothetical protein